MKKSKTAELEISAEQTWRAIGNRFADNGLWAASLTSSYLIGELKQGVVRVCMNKQQKIVEELTLFNPNNMELSYKITSKLPFFILTATNHWSVKSLGPNRSSMTSTVTTDLVWWAKVLSPLMALGIDNILTKAMAELKYWAQTGKQHPRKKAYNDKFSEFVSSNK